MLESDAPSPTLLLFPEDYPPIFRNAEKLYAHPDDYNVIDNPITPYTFAYRQGTRLRLFLRTSLSIPSGKFTTATFLLDTGCCPHLYVSDTLKSLLADRIQEDDLGTQFMTLKFNEEKHRLLTKVDLPSEHKSVNVIGLPMFFLLGFKFHEGNVRSFDTDVDGVIRGVLQFREGYTYL